MRPDGLAREGWVLLTRTSGTRALRAGAGGGRARAVVTAVTLALAATTLAGTSRAASPNTAAADPAPPTYDVTIPAVHASLLADEKVAAAGTTGYALATRSGFSWVRFDGGPSYPIGQVTGPVYPVLDAGRELLTYTAGPGVERVADPIAGTAQDFALPDGYTVLAATGTGSGWGLLAASTHTDASGRPTGVDYHVLDAEGSSLVERTPADLPQNTRFAPDSSLGEASGRILLTRAVGGQFQLSVLDLGTGALDVLPDLVPQSGQDPVFFNDTLLGWYGNGVARLYRLTDLSAAPTTLALPADLPGSPTGYTMVLTRSALLVVARDALWNDTRTTPLYSVPLDGGPATQLLPDASVLASTSDGGAVFTGGASADAWDTYRIDPDGATPIRLYHNDVVLPERFGLSLARGFLYFMEAGPTEMDSPSPWVYWQNEGVGAVPQPASGPNAYSGPLPAYSCDAQRTCSASLTDASETAGPAFVTHTTGGDTVYTTGTWGLGGVHLASSGGRIADAAENFLLYDSGSDGRQYLISTRDRTVALSRPAAPAALWGDTLWTATAVRGQVTQTGLRSDDPAHPVTMPSLTTDAPCAIKEIQADGAYLYWSCGAAGPAGVYDRTAKKSVPVPAGPALLGDGFVLRHSGDALEATDVRTGATRTAALLPADGALADTGRGVTWTVDKFRGQIAYTLPDVTTHLVPSGFAATPLDVVSQSPGTVGPLPARSGGGQVSFVLSGAAASSRLDIRGAPGGPVLRTVTGAASRSRVSLGWDGKDSAGRYVTDGSYSWTLTAVPADGSGPDLVRSGTLRVVDASAAPRDFGLLGHDPDAIGDLFTPDTKGYLIAHYGTGAGGFDTVKGYGGWNTAATLFVPIGDIDDNGCNDMLVRLPSGEARAYRAGSWPGCAGFAANSTAYTRIGTGWQTYDAVTSPGDITGDGLPDVIARTRSTGELWLYASNGTGGFKARTLMYTKWGGYTKLIGAGDLNGDGIGDLLGWDSTGLWRYYGTPHGTFGARALVFSRWGVGYNAVVGVGDITGDGRADLVERDSAGVLWRNSGDGKGSFGARVKIGTGYGSYAGMV